VSASSCVAVGYQYDPTEQNLAESWNGASWSVSPSSNPPSATSSYLNAVSCSSGGSCTAVGYQYDPTEQNLAESLSTGPPPQETLTVTTGGSGSGTVTGSGISCPASCTGSYGQGSIVTLSSTAASGSMFSGWSGVCSGTGTCTVTMNAAESVGATFINAATAVKADLSVAVTSSGIATVGGYMGYTIAVTNNGPATSDVALTDTTPSGLASKPTTFYCVGSVPTPGSGIGWCGPLPPSVKCMKPGVGSAGTVSCTTASLVPGASVTVIMAVRVGFYLHNQAICDTASATSTTTVDPNTSNNSATVCARVN
jgi:uncharacterized repeat protein (TIGR01451 family)